MVFEDKKGEIKTPGKHVTVNDKIAEKVLKPELPAPGWDWKEMSLLKKALVVMVVLATVGMLLTFSLPASSRNDIASAIFAKTSTDASGTGPSGGITNPLIIGAATPTPTPGQEKNQIDMDRNDPILSQRIDRLEMGGKTLMPINNLPQEIQIGDSVYITDLKVKNGVTCNIENRGKKTLFINIDRFTFITKDYIFVTYLKIIYIDGQYGASAAQHFKPGQKKSFSTIDTKDINAYKKIGGLPEDFKQIEQELAQSSYLQINGVDISDT